MAKETIIVRGMSCAACVRRVELGLSNMQGVASASVNFAAEKATVEYDPSVVQPSELQAKIRDMGYEPVSSTSESEVKPQKTAITIGGMNCAACVRRVENTLKKVPGVIEATVNLASGKAVVEHSAGAADVFEIKRALDDAGYQFLGVVGENADDPLATARREELAELRIKLIVGAVLSVLVHAVAAPHLFPFLHSLPSSWMLFASFLMTTPVVFWVGSRFIVGAYKAALQRTSDMNTLVSVGALSAYIYSSVVTFFPNSFDTAGIIAPVYFDGAAMNFHGYGFQLGHGTKRSGRPSEEKPVLFACGGAMLVRR
ncbi:MAG: copper ion binding protein, partial [Desulfomonile tiedjei]|nr:copper ion binding protein [Desulfomonile tiedjei]